MHARPGRAAGASHGYRVVPGGRGGRLRMMTAVERDSLLRMRAVQEATRMAGASPHNGSAHELLGFFALMDGRYDDAETHFLRVIALDPRAPRIHSLLAFLAQQDGRAEDARRWYARERAISGSRFIPAAP